MSELSCLLVAILALQLPSSTHAHGRLLVPGSRPSGYLKGYAMPVNYNDHEMNCGGRVVQWDLNRGKCGICGDPWSGPRHYERPNGVMAQHNIITETYQENQIITIRLQITVTHAGWHEFRICDVAKSGGVEATQECLDKILLANETRATRFTKGTTAVGFYDYSLVLPRGLTCRHCVIQWKWKCGNDWGCGDQGCCLGCGERQEEFYSCADVAIISRDSRYTTPRSPVTTTTTRNRPTTTTTRYRPTTTTTRYRPTTTTTRYRPTTTTRRYQPITRQPTTRQQWRTTQRSTPAPTRRPTTAKPRSTTLSYNYNVIYNYFKKNPRNGQTVGTIKFPDRSNTNGNSQSNKTTDELFLDMILERGSQIVNQDGLSVPVPSDNSTTQSDAEYGKIIESDKIVRDRLCAVCFYSCHYNLCYNYCPQVCKSSQSNILSG